MAGRDARAPGEETPYFDLQAGINCRLPSAHY
jgi:hypothetical protein